MRCRKRWCRSGGIVCIALLQRTNWETYLRQRFSIVPLHPTSECRTSDLHAYPSEKQTWPVLCLSCVGREPTYQLSMLYCVPTQGPLQPIRPISRSSGNVIIHRPAKSDPGEIRPMNQRSTPALSILDILPDMAAFISNPPPRELRQLRLCTSSLCGWSATVLLRMAPLFRMFER